MRKKHAKHYDSLNIARQETGASPTGDWKGSSRLFFALLAILVFLGAYFRLSYVLHAPHIPVVSDAQDYVNIAKGIVNRGTMSYGYNPGPSSFVMPGFPLFLAAVFKIAGQDPGSMQIVRFLFAMVSLSWIVLIFLLVRDATENRRLALLAAMVVCLYPPFTWCSERILTEVPYTMAVTLSLWLLVRAWKYPSWKNSLFAGLSIGLSLLVRPIMLYFIPLFFLLDFFKSRRLDKSFLIRSGVLLGAVVLCLAPWIIRNAIQFKAFIPLSTSGGNPMMIGTYYNYNRTDSFPSGKTEIETDRLQKEFAKKRFLEEMKKDPVKYSLWYLGKIRSLWVMSYGVYDGWDLPPARRVGVQIFHQMMVMGFLFGMICILVFFDVSWFIPLLFLVYHTLILVPFIGIPRYSFPMMPVACAVSGYGVWRLGKSFKEHYERMKQGRVGILLLVGLGGIVCSVLFNRTSLREGWMARGFSPGVSLFFSICFVFLILSALIIPLAWIWTRGKDGVKRSSFLLMTLFLMGFFLVIFTPAGGLNPFTPLYAIYYREGYTFLVAPGDTAAKVLDLPEWTKQYEKYSLRIFMGFSQKAGKEDHVGIFIDDKQLLPISGENPMPPNWYEIQIPKEFLEGKKSITISVKRLSSGKTADGSIVPFLVGLRFRLPRGKNSFNGQNKDLAPYVEGVQTGSYMIALRMARDGSSSEGILWWGRR